MNIEQQKALALASARKRMSEAQTKPMPGIGETIIDQAGQGLTFGFGDEFFDRAGAGIVSLQTGKPYSELLQIARNESKERLANQMRERPVLSIASNVGGSLLTGGAAGLTKTGQAAGNFIRSGNLGARVAKGALAGGATASAYGAGTAEEGQRGQGALDALPYGVGFGAAVPLVTSAIGGAVKGTGTAIKGFKAQGSEQLDDLSSAMRQEAGALYQKARDAGAVINEGTSRVITNKVARAINALGPANKELHGSSLSVLKDLTAKIKKDKFLTLEEVDQFRQLFSDAVRKNVDFKGVNADGLRAVKAIEAIDDAIDGLNQNSLLKGDTSAVEALKSGRSAWGQMRKFEKVADIVQRSEGDANALKRNLQRFVSNPKNLRGFTTDEVKALKEAGRNTAPELLLKTFGKFGFDLGGSRSPGNTFLPAISSLYGLYDPTGIALAVGGTGARQLQKGLASGKAQAALDLIARGSQASQPQMIPQNVLAQLAIQSNAISAPLSNALERVR